MVANACLTATSLLYCSTSVLQDGSKFTEVFIIRIAWADRDYIEPKFHVLAQNCTSDLHNNYYNVSAAVKMAQP